MLATFLACKGHAQAQPAAAAQAAPAPPAKCLPAGNGYIATGYNGWQVSLTVVTSPQPNFTPKMMQIAVSSMAVGPMLKRMK